MICLLHYKKYYALNSMAIYFAFIIPQFSKEY